LNANFTDEYVMRFQVQGTDKQFHLLADAAQEAEFLHEEKNGPQMVVALLDDPGIFVKDEVVYTSQGGRE
jgi:hypothetical protein